ncbi:MAG: hypothetical protein Q4E68_02510 [Prevotellaceae bacterium]|nr:hypothetical protein [Prevotellaceae bacterium]
MKKEYIAPTTKWHKLASKNNFMAGSRSPQSLNMKNMSNPTTGSSASFQCIDNEDEAL